MPFTRTARSKPPGRIALQDVTNVGQSPLEISGKAQSSGKLGKTRSITTPALQDLRKDEDSQISGSKRRSQRHSAGDETANDIFSIDDLESSSVDGDNMFSFTGSLLQATPMAKESSTNALRRFKRRPRQPSMLTMVRQRIASTQSSPARRHIDSDPLSDDTEDFEPEMAGTPAHIVASAVPRSTAASQRSKRRSTRNSQTVAATADSTQFVTALDAEAFDIELEEREQPTMSPSSRLRHSRLPEVAASPEDTSLFADPVTQQTPSPEQGRGKRRKLNKVLSTADLQSLLPRRRRMMPGETPLRRDEFDHSSSPMSPTVDDESFRIDTHHARSKRVPNSAKRSANHGIQAKSAPVTMKKHARKRARANDKLGSDDEVLHEHTTEPSIYVTSISDDLELAKQKFAEIDQWEMEFEDISSENTLVSSQ